jgi:hypothetical protein
LLQVSALLLHLGTVVTGCNGLYTVFCMYPN